jgi:hypothetical protein
MKLLVFLDDPGSNLGNGQKLFSYSVCVEFELKSVGLMLTLEQYLLIYAY